MAKSVIHHYIPEFLLRAWTSEDGRLERFSRVHDAKIHVRRVFPSQVGFERRLYDFGDEQFLYGLEGAYFSPVDNVAAKARYKLLTDMETAWTSELRSGWTRFLLSLFHRSPKSIEIFRSKISLILQTHSANIQQQYEEIRKEGDPEGYLEYMLAWDGNYFDNTAQRLLPQIIENANLGTFINRMTWAVYDVSKTRFELLLSDYPLVISNGIKKPEGHLALALAPDKLFVACFVKDLVGQILNQGDELVVNYNRIIVERASSFVAATDRGQERFIRNRFGKKPLNYLDSVFDKVQLDVDDQERVKASDLVADSEGSLIPAT